MVLSIAWIYLSEKVANLFNPQRSFIERISTRMARDNILYIKIFQALSSHEDIISNEDREYLLKYTENVPYTRDDYDIVKIMTYLRDQDISLYKLEPIASGVISLVFHGWDNTSKQEVAIKVKREGINNRIDRDLKDLKTQIDFFQKFTNLNIKDIYEENKDILMNQVNFNQEVENIKFYHKINENFNYIKIPKVYEELSNDDTIVMEYIRGNRLNDIIDTDDSIKYGNLLSKFIFKHFLIDRCFHGDMHPGNIIFLKDEDGNHQLGIIDFGIIGRLTREEQDVYVRSLKAFHERDIYEAYEIAIEDIIGPRENIDNLNKKDSDKLKDSLLVAINDVINQQDEDNSFHQIDRLSKALVNFNLKIKPVFAKVEMSIGVSQGVLDKLIKGHVDFFDLLMTTFEELTELSL
jgi:ubiquinone biosynthesis protein